MRVSEGLWLIWYTYWVISARNRVRASTGSNVKRESLAGRLFYQVLLVAGFVLLFTRRVPELSEHIWNDQAWISGVGLALQVAGLGFAVWGREVLGANWSARIATSTSQELIIRGPYRFVRHPIYSGLLLAVFGTAIVSGRGTAVLGAVLVLISVLIKIRREETALREHFGSSYQDYASRVRGLVPGVGSR